VSSRADLPEGFDAACWLADDAVTDRYAADWSGMVPQRPTRVFRPGSAEELSRFLAWCNARRQPVTVQGGMTGLVGGAMPREGEWAVSLERLNDIVDVDPDGMTLTAGAGTPLETMQRAADDAGLSFPVDLGARGTATAGGLVSTNAGGTRVIRRGMTRANVLGLTAVLADGTVVDASNVLPKNNAGFDVKQCFIGSEGLFGIVTRVTFALAPRGAGRHSALVATDDFAGVVALLRKLREDVGALAAYEVMWRPYYEAALAATGIADPFDEPPACACLVEASAQPASSSAETFEAVLGRAVEDGIVTDAALAASEADAARFWAIRDGIGELLPKLAPLANFDVGVPIAKMARFVDTVQAALEANFADCRLLVFGHVADSNLHLVATTGREADVDGLYETVYRITGELGGSISAEHGIGIMKRPYLRFSRSAEEIQMMRMLKRALDPNDILNPGRMLPP